MIEEFHKKESRQMNLHTYTQLQKTVHIMNVV